MEMLEDAEKFLLSLEQGKAFSDIYNPVFRVFHSLKGGAGMLGLKELQHFVHEVETQFQSLKGKTNISSAQVGYFLKGLDFSRELLNGKKLNGKLEFPQTEEFSGEIKTELDRSTSTKEDKTIRAELKGQGGKVIHAKSVRLNDLIYLIDDEKDILEILSDSLMSPNWKIKTFHDPVAAMAQMEADRPDLVLTDFKMPGKSGLDILKYVSQVLPQTPVIFLSGFLSKDILLHAIEMGLFAALEKPFSPTKVTPIIDQALEKKRIQKTLNDAINFIFYQYSDLKEFLASHGDETIAEIMDEQLKALLQAHKKINRRKILDTP